MTNKKTPASPKRTGQGATVVQNTPAKTPQNTTTKTQPGKAPPTPSGGTQSAGNQKNPAPVGQSQNNGPAGKPLTPVGKWLTDNKAETYIPDFDKAGYVELGDLTPEVIKSTLVLSPQGIIARLSRVRSEELLKQNKLQEQMATTLQAPKLVPNMTLDLSAPVLKDASGISFKLPDLGLGTASGEQQKIVSAAELQPEQWLRLAKDTDMLHGVDLDGFFSGNTSRPQTVFKPALWWKVPESNDFFDCEHLKGGVSTDITYTAEASTMVASGFTKVSASVSTPFVAGSFEHETKSKKAQASQNTNLHVVVKYDFDRVRVDLEQCTTASKPFVAAVKRALKNSDPKKALYTVFKDYGEVIGKKITLGGRLYSIHVKQSAATSNIESLETSISAAVEGKYGAIGGSVGVAHGEGTQKSSETQNLAEKVSFTAIGGDTTLANNPELWKNTMKAPNTWEVIRYDELRSTIDLLDKDLQQQVLKYWVPSQGLGRTTIEIPAASFIPQSSVGVGVYDYYGQGVIINVGTGSNSTAEYEFESEEQDPTRYRMESLYAAAESRPVQVFFNNELLSGSALVNVTGGWYPANQIFETLGFVTLKTGKNCLRIYRAGAIPHIAKIRLSPESVTISAKSFNSNSLNVEADKGYDAIITPKAGKSVAHYEFDFAGLVPAKHQLQVLCAADESRPVDIYLNDMLITHTGAAHNTGGWHPSNRILQDAGLALELSPGKNLLRIEREGVIPHIAEFRFVPC